MDASRIGIYLNPQAGTVVRITSPYWLPEEPDWVLLTNDPNATLVTLQDIIKEKALLPEPSAVRWTGLPVRE